MRLSVAARCRPPSAQPAELVRLHLHQSIVETPRRAFQFDGLFAGDLDSERLYEQCALPLVEGVLGGQSGALIATGAERSGKSYALFGLTDGQVGAAVRALCDLVSAARAHGDGTVCLRWWLLAEAPAGGAGAGAHAPSATLRYDLLAPSAPAIVPDAARARSLQLCSAADVHEAVARALVAHRRAELSAPAIGRAHALAVAEYAAPGACAELVLLELGAPPPAHAARGPQHAQRGVPAASALCAALRGLAASASARGGGGGGGGYGGAAIGWRDAALTRELKPHLERAAACAVLLCVDPADRALHASIATLGWGRRLQRFVPTAPCAPGAGAGARGVLAAAQPPPRWAGAGARAGAAHGWDGRARRGAGWGGGGRADVGAAAAKPPPFSRHAGVRSPLAWLAEDEPPPARDHRSPFRARTADVGSPLHPAGRAAARGLGAAAGGGDAMAGEGVWVCVAAHSAAAIASTAPVEAGRTSSGSSSSRRSSSSALLLDDESAAAARASPQPPPPPCAPPRASEQPRASASEQLRARLAGAAERAREAPPPAAPAAAAAATGGAARAREVWPRQEEGAGAAGAEAGAGAGLGAAEGASEAAHGEGAHSAQRAHPTAERHGCSRLDSHGHDRPGPPSRPSDGHSATLLEGPALRAEVGALQETVALLLARARAHDEEAAAAQREAEARQQARWAAQREADEAREAARRAEAEAAGRAEAAARQLAEQRAEAARMREAMEAREAALARAERQLAERAAAALALARELGSEPPSGPAPHGTPPHGTSAGARADGAMRQPAWDDRQGGGEAAQPRAAWPGGGVAVAGVHAGEGSVGAAEPHAALRLLDALEAELRRQLHARATQHAQGARAGSADERRAPAQQRADAEPEQRPPDAQQRCAELERSLLRAEALGRGREQLLLNALAAHESERAAMAERLAILERLVDGAPADPALLVLPRTPAQLPADDGAWTGGAPGTPGVASVASGHQQQYYYRHL